MSVSIVQTNEKDLTKFAFAIQQLARGRSNAVGRVTLRPNQTTTTVACETCGPESEVILIPRTASAEAATRYPSATGAGSFTITHDSSPATDRIFGYFTVG